MILFSHERNAPNFMLSSSFSSRYLIGQALKDMSSSVDLFFNSFVSFFLQVSSELLTNSLPTKGGMKKKRINFSLMENKCSSLTDIDKSILDSPDIPFHADKKPKQGVLKKTGQVNEQVLTKHALYSRIQISRVKMGLSFSHSMF